MAGPMESIAPLVRQLLDASHPQTIVEVGAAGGQLTAELCDWATANHSSLQVVSPLPSKLLFQLMMECKHAHLHLGRPLEKLRQLEPAACYFIYDDFNYYSTFQQLRLIMANGMPELLFIFGIGWPTGRSDSYRDQSLIPADYLHKAMAHRDNSNLAPLLQYTQSTDFFSGGALHLADKSDGPRNGVLTAVEDVLDETSGYRFLPIDIGRGIAILLRHDFKCFDAAIKILEPYLHNQLQASSRRTSDKPAQIKSVQTFDMINAPGVRPGGTMAYSSFQASRQASGHLYLQLLKKVLLGILYSAAEQPTLESQGFSFAVIQLRLAGLDWPEHGFTMIGMERLNNVEYCVEDVLWNDVPGDLVETGVWRGGTCIFMRAILKTQAATNRTVWVADSFQGVPPPNPQKYPYDENIDLSGQKQLIVSRQEVERNFECFDLLDEQVHFLEGWFKDTLPGAPINRIAVLRLDGDLYESTMDALTALYPKVSPGGYIIVDDFGGLSTCRRAVLDYREQHGITDVIHTIDWTGVYWQRSL